MDTHDSSVILPRNATLVIMRGEPGSGKSKRAKELKKKLEKRGIPNAGIPFLEKRGLRVGIFSTDSIFHNADGEYEFVPYAIGAAHSFMRSSLIFLCGRENDVYILDNTTFNGGSTLTLSGTLCLQLSPYLFGTPERDLTTVTFMVYLKIESK